ncbi:MAG: hypothetical protein AB1333_03050 [Patescibacteria group bacterium]
MGTTVLDILKAEQTALDIAAQKIDLTYEQVCGNLKFYCGWNPKTEEGIKEQITSGLPQLKDVKVKVWGFFHVKITFTMPDGTRRKYEYK